jgi:hypothetical protein
METAHPINDKAGVPRTGAASLTAGTLPTKRATVIAEVLARLLAGERLTGMVAVFDASTTRLSDVVFRLQRDYGWTIERADKAAGCKDGRVATVSVYWLAPEAVAKAVAAGAAAWCAEVRVARLQLRMKAAQARRAAERANRVLSKRYNPRQSGLFDGEGASV